MVMCPYDVDKQLKILKDFFFSSMNMLVNINRTNVYDNEIQEDELH